MDSVFVVIATVFVVALILTAILTALLIPVLKKHKAKQTIHEDVPDNHQAKSGTPTMGGIAIVLGASISSIIAFFLSDGIWQSSVFVTILAFVVFALLGFMDDYNKVINKRNLGLTARQKLLLQCLIALILSAIFIFVEQNPTTVSIPFTDLDLDLGYGYIIFMVFAIVAMVNSVNLTDGLDGLASGVSLIICLFFGLTSIAYSVYSSNWFFFALAGACVGFLIFNKNPARIFMGDTGSMAIGGGMTIAAFYADMELILIIAGFVYVAEALSDIIQVASYKLRGGKRVFKMAPLHHHFELSGWSEKKVVGVFMLVTLLLCIISLFA